MLPASVSTSVIALKHVFGLNTNLKNHVHFLNDHRIVYPAGHNVVLYNVDDKSQTFISGIEGYKGISAMTVSPTRKFLAIAEKGDKPSIYVFETISQRRRKVMNVDGNTFKEFVAMAFAPGQENKYFICLSGNPDPTLCYFLSEKPKLLASVKVPSGESVVEIAFNPNDITFVSCIGYKVFKCFKLIDNQLKLIHSQLNGVNVEISHAYTTHCWLHDGNVVIGTQAGELILLNSNCEFIMVLPSSPMKGWYIECIVPTAKGFMIGGDSMTVYIYEASSEPFIAYERVNTITLRNPLDTNKDAKIRTMSLVPDLESKLAISTYTNQLYTVNLKQDNPLGDERDFEQIAVPFHTGAINGMDIAVRKPLIATCGTDKFVRIWNYEENILECQKAFPDEAYSISFHPSGFLIVVGFSDKVKLMSICNISTTNPFKVHKDIPIKNCKEVKFSTGGQYFAAVIGNQNQQTIHCYKTYTGENPSHLIFKGHTSKVRALVWSKNDAQLVSCGADGMVYVWTIKDGSRACDYSAKNVAFSSCAITADNKIVYAVGNDRTIKEIIESQLNKQLEAGVTISQLAFTNSNKLLFAGVCDEQKASGSLRCYKYPLAGSYTEYQAHDCVGIEKTRVSNDDQFLITAGRDGCLMIFEIKDKEARGMKLKDGYTKYADEILVSKEDINELKANKQNLEQQLQETKTNPEMTKLSSKEDAIRHFKERLINESQNAKAKFDSLIDARREMEQKNEEELQNIREKNEEEIQQLETAYQARVMREVEEYERLKKEQDEKNLKYAQEKAKLEQEHNIEMRRIEEEYNSQIEEELRQKDSIKAERAEKIKEHAEIISQIKDETTKEIENLTEKNKKEVKSFNESSLKAKGDVSIALKRLAEHAQEEAMLKDQQREYEEQRDQLKKTRDQYKIAIEEHKRIIAARDKDIGDKEKKIYDLKKKTQELEKFKFVLDYKIKELKRDIGPREQEIQTMKIETNKMDEKLKNYNSANNTLALVVHTLDTKQTEMFNHIKQQRLLISTQAVKIKRFKDEVYQTVQYIQNFEKLQECVTNLKNTYAKDHVKVQEIDPDIYAEYVSQKDYLEKSVAMLKQHLQKDHEIHKQDNLRIMRENVELIKEINKLRDDMGESIGGRKNKMLLNKMKMIQSPELKNTDLEAALSIMEKKKKTELQKEEIKSLKQRFEQLRIENENLQKTNS